MIRAIALFGSTLGSPCLGELRTQDESVFETRLKSLADEAAHSNRQTTGLRLGCCRALDLLEVPRKSDV